METLTTQREDALVIHLHGRLAHPREGEAFHAEVSEAIAKRSPRVVIDISNVDWMNSTGLAMLVRAYVALSNAGVPVSVSGANDAVRTVMKSTKLDTVFGLHHTVADAIQAMK